MLSIENRIIEIRNALLTAQIKQFWQRFCVVLRAVHQCLRDGVAKHISKLSTVLQHPLLHSSLTSIEQTGIARLIQAKDQVHIVKYLNELGKLRRDIEGFVTASKGAEDDTDIVGICLTKEKDTARTMSSTLSLSLSRARALLKLRRSTRRCRPM